MKLTRLRCPNCGADFENIDVTEDQKVFKCTRLGCGASFILDQGIRFADIKQADAEKIEHYREELKRSLSPFDRHLAGRYAENILAILPDDYRAKAILAIAQSGEQSSRPLYYFLQSDPACTPEEFEEVFPCLLEHCDYRGLNLLRETVSAVEPEERRRTYFEKIDRQTDYLKRKIEDYADIPRDIFVCHSSDDLGIVMKVVNALEADGNKCWYSERNMPPDSLHYWEKIRKAIRRCTIFLVCCSGSAMMSDPVQTEIEFAEEAKVKRLELKLDDAPHTSLFKHFFDGISWVKLDDDFDGAMRQLKEFVYQLKHAERNAEENAAQKKAEEERLLAEQRLLREKYEALLREQEEEKQRLEELRRQEEEKRKQEEQRKREEAEQQRLAEEKHLREEAERRRLESEQKWEELRKAAMAKLEQENPTEEEREHREEQEQRRPDEEAEDPKEAERRRLESEQKWEELRREAELKSQQMEEEERKRQEEEERRRQAELAERQAALKRQQREAEIAEQMRAQEKAERKNSSGGFFTLIIIAVIVGLACWFGWRWYRNNWGTQYVTLGRYEQSNAGRTDPIQWQVLAKTDDRMLVISRYGLETRPYHNTDQDITWADSDLRAWLNGTFYDTAFTTDEKARIIEVVNQNPDYNTKDKVFLLSLDEAQKYFKNDDARECQPTYHAKQNGAYEGVRNHSTHWWLRSPGYTGNTAAVILWDGAVHSTGLKVTGDTVTVRPAMWVTISESGNGK